MPLGVVGDPVVAAVAARTPRLFDQPGAILDVDDDLDGLFWRLGHHTLPPRWTSSRYSPQGTEGAATRAAGERSRGAAGGKEDEVDAGLCVAGFEELQHRSDVVGHLHGVALHCASHASQQV